MPRFGEEGRNLKCGCLPVVRNIPELTRRLSNLNEMSGAGLPFFKNTYMVEPFKKNWVCLSHNNHPSWL